MLTIPDHINSLKKLFSAHPQNYHNICPYAEADSDRPCVLCKGFVGLLKDCTCPCSYFGKEEAKRITLKRITKWEESERIKKIEKHIVCLKEIFKLTSISTTCPHGHGLVKEVCPTCQMFAGVPLDHCPCTWLGSEKARSNGLARIAEWESLKKNSQGVLAFIKTLPLPSDKRETKSDKRETKNVSPRM